MHLQGPHMAGPCLQASWVTHAYDGLLLNEFNGLSLRDLDGQLVPAQPSLPVNLQSKLTMGQDFAVVVGALVGLRAIVYAELQWVARTHRL